MGKTFRFSPSAGNISPDSFRENLSPVLDAGNLPRFRLPQKPTYIPCARDIDFYALFERIEPECANCFFLESLGDTQRTSRYSVIGFDPLHIISGVKNTLVVDGVSYVTNNPYFALRTLLPHPTISRGYAGGLVGFISYDAVHYFEPSVSVRPNTHFDSFTFGFYTDGLVFDTSTREVFYFYYTKNRLPMVKAFLSSSPSSGSVHVRFVRHTLDRCSHAAHVSFVKEQIRLGNTFQCEVGFQTEYSVSGDTRRIYARLRDTNPSPYMYYLKFQDKKIIGASPELLFCLRNGQMETFPLAGTIRRGTNDLEDARLARQLLNDPKERAEHTMLIDLHRNDMGRVARFGSVKVRSLMDVKQFSHVSHLSSEITGLLQDGEDMFSALAAHFPAGTLTGAPKVETMKIIDRLETVGRGPYGGAIGHFGFNGDCTFAIAIRSLFLSGSFAYTQTCGGIVADSDADREYEEIQEKSAAMQLALRDFSSGDI